ncbi:MAG: carboxymuconolactone decarboxylase family protein [Burkholderiaceae bacterium]
MSSLKVYSIDSAPEKSKPVLGTIKETFGFVPNVAGVMSGSPTLIGGFMPLFQHVHGGTFTEPQIQTVLLTNAVTNKSVWPATFHTYLALEAGVPKSEVDAIRAGSLPMDAKLAALSNLARNLIEKKGHVPEDVLKTFKDGGFADEHVLEVIAIVAASAMTNYSSTVGQPPLEETFVQHRWNG